MDIISEAKKQQDFIVSIRRHLHEYPELSGQEFKTIELIKKELENANIEYVEAPDGGVLGFIDSNKPGKTILLRADCDALPIQEDKCNGLGKEKPCVSKVDGVQHACGHDAHTACLLGAARILNEHKDEFKGKIILCFERGEEGVGNIFYLIKYMLENNITYDACFGIHVAISLDDKPGCVLIKEDDFMAAMIIYQLRIVGKGGHGAKPEQCISPIKCFTYVYQAISEMYEKEYKDQLLRYSIGHVEAGQKCNIIPETLFFEGTIRYFDSEIGKNFSNKLVEVTKEVCDKYGCKLEVIKLSAQGLPVRNNKECCDIARKAFKDFRVLDCYTKLSSESFSYYQGFAPGVFINVGVTNSSKGIVSDVHTPTMDVDEDCLYMASAAHVAYALEYLNGDYDIKIDPIYKDAEDWVNRFGKII